MTTEAPTIAAAATKLLRLIHSSLGRADVVGYRAEGLEECRVALTNLRLIDGLDVHFADAIDAQIAGEEGDARVRHPTKPDSPILDYSRHSEAQACSRALGQPSGSDVTPIMEALGRAEAAGREGAQACTFKGETVLDYGEKPAPGEGSAVFESQPPTAEGFSTMLKHAFDQRDARMDGLDLRAAVTRPESPDIAMAVSKRMNATITMALKVEAGTLSHAAARLALAAGGYGPEVVARIDALNVHDHGSPEDEAGIKMGVDCVQRLMDEAGPGETVADVLNRLLAVSDRSRLEYSGGGPGSGHRQALVVTYSDSPDGPLSMFVDLEGKDGTALDPLVFTDAGRALVVGLEAIAANVEEAS